jgi:HD-GYP domain-containing protein (c-di-GMP phosphodiesterase class II)
VNLLAWIGCTADSHELAKLFGDDIALRASSYEVDLAGISQVGFLLRHVAAGESVLRRISAATTLLASSGAQVEQALTAHCEVTGRLAKRLGLDEQIATSLAHAFARWDGKGLPAGVGKGDIPLPARLLHLADIVVAHHRLGGVDRAVTIARARRGTQFDPELVDAFSPVAPALFVELDELSSWDEVISAEPALGGTLDPERFDTSLDVLADFADLKSPFFVGHSRGVADLVASAAEEAGRSPKDVALVRRAGLVHDIGRAGVPNTIWDKAGPLTSAELERVRLHDYYTERMLQRPAALAEIGAVASSGHERMDGSGYHRGSRGASIGALSKLLAAADAYHAMCENRPHRPSMAATKAAGELRSDARAGRLDGGAVDAVLTAAGHRRRKRPTGPAGLTPREIEVLVLLARGASNKQIATALGMTPKTAGSHVEHIYTKLGVSTRAAASLFATQHGLVADLPPFDVR